MFSEQGHFLGPTSSAPAEGSMLYTGSTQHRVEGRISDLIGQKNFRCTVQMAPGCKIPTAV